MTINEYSKIQRSLGVIEGIALSLESMQFDAVSQEIQAIEEILDKEMGDDAQ